MRIACILGILCWPTALAAEATDGGTIVIQAAGDDVYDPVYQDSLTWLDDAPLQKRLTTAEALALPGVLGDPLKAVFQIPGITAAGFGDLLVHGSKDGESSTTINQLPVGYLFHLGGLHSVFSPEAVEQFDVHLGAFDTTYGDAIGGVIDITPRLPGGDGTSGYAHLGLLDSSFGINAGLSGGWGIALHGRRSYIDLFLPKDIFDSDENRITTFPSYHDLAGSLAYTWGRHRFSIEALHAADRFGADLQENAVKDPAATGPLEARQGFTTAGLRWTFDSYAYAARTVIGRMDEYVRLGLFGDYFLDVETETRTLHHQSTWRQDRHEITAGLDIDWLRAPVDALAPAPPEDDEVDQDLTSAEIFRIRQTLEAVFAAVFLQDTWRATDRLSVRLGLRAEHSDLGAYRPIAMPRGAVIVDLTEADTLALSAGQYSARPETYKFFDRIGNPRLTDERSDQIALAWTRRTPGLGTWTVEPFFKELSQLAITASDPGFRNVGTGQAYGVDIALRLGGDDWYLSAAYAWQEARRRLTADDGQSYSFYGDVPHTAQVGGSWRFLPAWTGAFLVKYATGQPYTPIVGTYAFTDSDGSVRTRPRYGTPYSSRFPDYFTLNLRAGRTWDVWGDPLETSLEIINATNHPNITGYTYNDAYERDGEVGGFPLLAAVDLTWRF
jgi:hypothetical protein